MMSGARSKPPVLRGSRTAWIGAYNGAVSCRVRLRGNWLGSRMIQLKITSKKTSRRMPLRMRNTRPTMDTAYAMKALSAVGISPPPPGAARGTGIDALPPSSSYSSVQLS